MVKSTGKGVPKPKPKPKPKPLPKPLGAGKTSGAGTRGVSLNAAIGSGTGYSDTNRGESSNN